MWRDFGTTKGDESRMCLLCGGKTRGLAKNPKIVVKKCRSCGSMTATYSELRTGSYWTTNAESVVFAQALAIRRKKQAEVLSSALLKVGVPEPILDYGAGHGFSY
jgi:hypothetical protein